MFLFLKSILNKNNIFVIVGDVIFDGGVVNVVLALLVN